MSGQADVLRPLARAIGALNLFRTGAGALDDGQQRLGQAFANMAVAGFGPPDRT